MRFLVFSVWFFTVASPGTIHSCGSVILYRSTFELSKTAFDAGGRFVLANFKYHGSSFGLACVYAPNRNPERNEFFDFCVSELDPSVPTVICGDFNTVFHRSLDRRSSSVSDVSRESSLALENLFHDCCVVGIWHVLHPTTSAFTWLKPDGSLSSRIDLIGCPHSWLHQVDSSDILSCPFSDHSAVRLTCSVPELIPKGPGRWKLNVSILSDDTFVDAVKRFWLSWKSRKGSFGSLLSWWDRGKEKIKGLAINHCKEKSKMQCDSICSCLFG